MSGCNSNSISLIEETECLSESINTINSNFLSLSATTCQLKQRVEAIKMVRTFFYYGPNSQANSRSLMGYNQLSRPSDQRIFGFVNSSNFLDLPKISYPGDIVYVIYQKTGFRNNQRLGISTDFRFTDGSFTGDINNRFSPTFFVWKLVYEERPEIRPGSFYYISGNWPKIHRAETDLNNSNWNQPQNWSNYESWQNL